MAAFNIPEMESDEFALWQTLLEKRTGLWLPESRKAFLVAILYRHMKEQGISGYSELYYELSTDVIPINDWAKLVDSLTVHETCFYRDDASLKAVTNYCRNKALNEFQRHPECSQNINIWSVGCSTGEEVYTLAIEMDKLNIGLKEACGKMVYFGVGGIDISYPSLAVAREAIYAAKQLDFVSQATKNFYFDKLADDHYQISEQIKQRTCFIQGNVLDLGTDVKQKYDVIYCQNVLIYFRQERKQQLIEQLTKRLVPGGLLVLGHGEVIGLDNQGLTRVNNKHCLAYMRNDSQMTKMTE